MNNGYNGFNTRETWVVNLHFGEYLQDDLQQLYDDGAFDREVYEDDGENGLLTYAFKQHIEQFIDEQLEAVADSPNVFVRDMVNDSNIDYWELAELYVSDLDK